MGVREVLWEPHAPGVLHRQWGIQVRSGERAADWGARPPVGRPVGDVDAVEQHLAAVGGQAREITALFTTLAVFRAPYVLALGLVTRITGTLTDLVVTGRADRLRRIHDGNRGLLQSSASDCAAIDNMSHARHAPRRMTLAHAAPGVATAADDAVRQLARARLVEQNLPGLSVAVGVRGDIVWAEGFGWADIRERVPGTPETRFRIGTASSVLTSRAAGGLLERGGLTQDEEVRA